MAAIPIWFVGREHHRLKDRSSHRIVRVQEDGDATSRGEGFLKQFDPFGIKLRGEEGRAGHVSARTRKTDDETCCDSIAAHNHNNRDGRGGLFGRESARRPVCYEEIDFETNQFGREIWQSCVISFGPAEVNENVVTLNIAELTQTGSEAFQSALDTGLRVCAQKPDARGFCRLLRPCRQRPRGCAAEQRTGSRDPWTASATLARDLRTRSSPPKARSCTR